VEKVVERILREYGTAITLRGSREDCTFRGFLNHTGSHSWQNMHRNYSPLGEIPGGQYVLLAPLEPVLKGGDLLIMDGRRYRIRRLEKENLGGKAICQWGLCVEEGGDPA